MLAGEGGPRLRQMQRSVLVMADADQQHRAAQLVELIQGRALPENIAEIMSFR
ncbi:hypothetical protein D3C75_1292030 [compost metagenome]